MDRETLIKAEQTGRIGIITLNHPNPLNPISHDLNQSLCDAFRAMDCREDIDAIILTGGTDRSFSAGGDFKETVTINSADKAAVWVQQTINLYVTALSVRKPLVAALDGYAIGMGFQLALCTDWRIAAPGLQMIMWELEKGVACTLGSALLNHCFGSLKMAHIVYGCEPINANQACELTLVNELVGTENNLIATAVSTAKRLAAYPVVPFQRTKAFINSQIIAVLNDAAEISRRTHAECFSQGSAQPHFRAVLGKAD